MLEGARLLNELEKAEEAAKAEASKKKAEQAEEVAKAEDSKKEIEQVEDVDSTIEETVLTD